jgi:hypothetical protein
VYTLKGLTELTLDADFVTSVKKLVAFDAANDRVNADAMLKYIYSNYGTHYVNSATVGARYGVEAKMSSQSRDELVSKGISVSAEVSASFLVAEGKVSGSYDTSSAEAIQEACKEGSFRSFYAPAGVDIPFRSGGGGQAVPDCSAWKTALDSAQSYAVVGVKLEPLTTVFVQGGLWQTFLNIGELTQAQLDRAKQLIEDSHLSCAVLGENAWCGGLRHWHWGAFLLCGWTNQGPARRKPPSPELLFWGWQQTQALPHQPHCFPAPTNLPQPPAERQVQPRLFRHGRVVPVVLLGRKPVPSLVRLRQQDGATIKGCRDRWVTLGTCTKDLCNLSLPPKRTEAHPFALIPQPHQNAGCVPGHRRHDASGRARALCQ